MFWKKEKTLEDKLLESLDEADWEWMIVSSDKYPDRVFIISKIWYEFMKAWDEYTRKYGQKSMTISKEFFDKVDELARKRIIEQDIKQIGWYILDDDLREWIKNARKITEAWKQIESLIQVIEKIRSKY